MSTVTTKTKSASSVTVSVPGTTANLGPGFDSFGLALEVANLVTVSTTNKRTPLPAMVEATGRSFFLGSGLPPFPFSWKIKGTVPQARGLGSSVTVRLGILMGLNSLCGNPLSRHGIYRLCAELEGHPDNVAPCTLGSVVASAIDSGGVTRSVRLDLPLRFGVAVVVPEYLFIMTGLDGQAVSLFLQGELMVPVAEEEERAAMEVMAPPG